jgi:hypothetical protein
MPLPSEAEPRPPADFASALATEKPMMLVGGQAVNLWALYYHNRSMEFAPFVSRGADVLGDRATLEELGKLAGVKPQFFPLRPPSNEVGVVIAKDSNGLPLLIEVLRYVNGVNNEELREPSYTLAIGERQIRVLVPGPIALLKAKLANVVDLKQEGRQDTKHVHILARIIPAYLEDLCDAAAGERMEERKLIEFLEKLLAILTASRNRKVLSGLGIDARQIYGTLNGEGLSKVRAFLEKRLPRSLAG